MGTCVSRSSSLFCASFFWTSNCLKVAVKVSNSACKLRTSPFRIRMSASFWATPVSSWRFSRISISFAIWSNSAECVNSSALPSFGRREGGTISGANVVGMSFPDTFCWRSHMAKANCSLFSLPVCPISHRALKYTRQKKKDNRIYNVESISLYLRTRCAPKWAVEGGIVKIHPWSPFPIRSHLYPYRLGWT